MIIAVAISVAGKIEAFESHHIIPRYIQKKLNKCLEAMGKPKILNFDDSPAVLLTRAEHWWPDGLHKFISDSDRGLHWVGLNNRFGNTADDLKNILDELEQAYEIAERPDLVKVVADWRKTIE